MKEAGQAVWSGVQNVDIRRPRRRNNRHAGFQRDSGPESGADRTTTECWLLLRKHVQILIKHVPTANGMESD